MGPGWTESAASGQIAGCGKPVGHVPTSDRGEEAAEAQVHADLQASLGGSFENMEPMASSGPPHAAGNSQKMAYDRVSLLLALEVTPETWSALDFPGNAKSDSETEPGKSSLGS